MRACWLKWVGRDWSISADYIWLNYSDANNLFPLSFGNRMVLKFRKRRPNMRKGMLGRISKTGIDSREKAPPRRLETCDRQIRFGE